MQKNSKIVLSQFIGGFAVVVIIGLITLFMGEGNHQGVKIVLLSVAIFLLLMGLLIVLYFWGLRGHFPMPAFLDYPPGVSTARRIQMSRSLLILASMVIIFSLFLFLYLVNI